MDPSQHRELQRRSAGFKRSYTDLIRDQDLRKLLKPREKAIRALKMTDETASFLAQDACADFEWLEHRGVLTHDDLQLWGRLLSRLAGLETDNGRKAEFYRQAIERTKQALEIKPDMHEALHSWGYHLGELADLEADPVRSRVLHEQAIDRYKQAVEIKPDTHEALNNWAIELLQIAHLAAAEDETQRRLLDEARDVLGRCARIRGVAVTSLYSYACTHAIGRDADAAFASLQESLVAGNIGTGHVRTDSDWEGLRDDPRFEAILKGFERGG